VIAARVSALENKKKSQNTLRMLMLMCMSMYPWHMSGGDWGDEGNPLRLTLMKWAFMAMFLEMGSCVIVVSRWMACRIEVWFIFFVTYIKANKGEKFYSLKVSTYSICHTWNTWLIFFKMACSYAGSNLLLLFQAAVCTSPE